MRRLCPRVGFAVAVKWDARRSHGTCPEPLHQNRAPKFAVLSSGDVDAFRHIVGAANVFVDSGAMTPYMECWFHHYKARTPQCVVLPKTTGEVAALLQYCNERSIAVVPQGGNTNFVGSAVPVFDEVVLSLKRMDAIIEVDEMSATLKCEAGCILETLDEHLKAKHNLMMPVDLGAKGSCHIGGNVSTNAGGLRYMRYGSLHGNVLGVKAVLASGEVLDLLTTCKKDNTGMDLKQLFIGSEGTLGVVTEVALQLPPKPQNVQTMFLGLASWEHLQKAFVEARKQLSEILSAVEMIDGVALDMCLAINKAESPLGSGKAYPYYLLLETNGSCREHDAAKLEAFLDSTMSSAIVADGTLAQSASQAKHIWSMREACAVAPNSIGYVRWYDVCMPASRMAELADGTRAELAKHGMQDRAKIVLFGHLGDGNAHLNLVCVPRYDGDVVAVADGFIYSYAKERRYSISAEHGIGVQKRKYLSYTKPAPAIEWMKRMKQLFDPKGILNPYKVIDVSGAPPAE